MKRPLSLAATIIGTVVLSFQMIMMLFSSIGLLTMIMDAQASVDPMMVLALLASVILSLLLIVAFAFNCVSYTYVNADPAKYARRKALTITMTVLSFVLIALLLISCAGNMGSSLALSIISAIALLVANILYFVDLGREKGKVVNLEE